MGIRLLESIRFSCSGANPYWGTSAMHTSVLFDGEFFAVSSKPAASQPDGVHSDLDWSADSFAPCTDELFGWYGPCELELLELRDLAIDGYIAEPAA